MSIFRQLARKIHGPRCHVTPEEKGWVERRMGWIKEQFGPAPIRRAPLEPTSDVLPKSWDASYTAGADLFNRLCRFMLLDPVRFQLHFYSRTESHQGDSDSAGEFHSSGPAGLYGGSEKTGKVLIALEESGLLAPAQLAATICHELGHVYLLGERRIKREEEDCEPLTDLLTVYFWHRHIDRQLRISIFPMAGRNPSRVVRSHAWLPLGACLRLFARLLLLASGRGCSAVAEAPAGEHRVLSG